LPYWIFRGDEDRGMARLGRYFVDGQALHVIQRGNNRQAIFFAREDYKSTLTPFLRLLQSQCSKGSSIKMALTPF
jgi:hypothetical protein